MQIGDNHYHQHNLEIDTSARYKNNLRAVAHELPYNFRGRGNAKNPFITQALEKLVHDEPMVQMDSKLFEKASKCLNIARVLSTTEPYHPTLKPADGQRLMKDLAECISVKLREID